jgi:D-alanine-D-alanine ligase
MKKVACIFGGESPEYEVSIVSAENVTHQLREAGYDVLPIGIDPAGTWHTGSGAFHTLRTFNGDPTCKKLFSSRMTLSDLDFDVVFPLIHGRTGEDGGIQGFCELLGIPFVGGGVLNQSLCMDKITSKRLLCQSGFPQPLWREVLLPGSNKDRDRILRSLESELGYPVFIKPSRAGSSIGISKAKNRMELISGLDIAFAVDSRVIVEQGVPNPVEIELSAMGGADPFLSVPGRIQPRREYYDFKEKYLAGQTLFEIPAAIPESMNQDMVEQARQAWVLFDCYGMARIDFLCSGSTVYLSELNTIPGFTGISMYPGLLEKSGVSQPELMNTLIELAFARHRTSQVNFRYNSHDDWYRHSTSSDMRDSSNKGR